MTLQWDQLIKYLLEGLAVSLASNIISKGKLDVKEIVMLGVTAAATFLVLDYFAPSITAGARQGAGFGLGSRLVTEGMEDMEPPYSVQAGGYYYDEETSEPVQAHPQTPAPVEEDTDAPYKLVDGQYSHKVLLAGYNKKVKAYNNKCNAKLAKWPFPDSNPSSDVQEQSGGWWADDAPTPESQEKAAAQEKAEQPATTATPTTQTTAAPAPQDPNAQAVLDRNYRKADALYSGDLIDLKQNDNVLQRGTIDSQIVFDKPLPKVATNLSKLRFIHPKHEQTRQTVINYGEPVYLMHNAYFNNTNQAKYIKYGERLQSHQDGPLFRAYKIFDADNHDRKGAVEPGTEVILARGDQEGDNVYLKVEGDKTVSSKNPQSDASRFNINLKRVYELHGKNLCVCPDDVLYP